MTRLRQIAMAGLAAIAIGGVASSASAMETGTFQNRLNGATIGLPLGALPPPGLYTGLETAYLGLAGTTAAPAPETSALKPRPGTNCAILPAIAQAVPLLWVPGWNFWGATYSASVVQAFYIYTTCGVNGSGNCNGGTPISGGGFVYTNTFLQPINLSWKSGRRLVHRYGLLLHGAGRLAHGGSSRRTRTTGPLNLRSRSLTSAKLGGVGELLLRHQHQVDG